MAFFNKRNYFKQTIFPNREALQFKEFKWTYKALISAIKERLRIEKDNFILVTGRTGSGKSHFTANINLKFLSKEPNFITGEGMMFEKENFVIDPEEFAVKMITNKGSSIWIDEGRDSSNRQNWQKKINQTIIGRKNKNRKLFNIYWLLLPFEREVDPRLAGHLTLWLWVRRGVVEVFCASPNFKGSKGLDIQAILDRDEKYRKENPDMKIVPPYIHPEFIGRLFFNKLTAGYKKQYDDLVIEKHATGELSEEEKLKIGLVENLSPETHIKNTIKDIIEGNIGNKKDMWEKLITQTGLPDQKLLKQLNFYLKLEGLPTFNKLMF